MAKWTHETATTRLSESPNNISCTVICRMLEDLGFSVKPGKSGNHYTFSHPKIKNFHGSNYDCGHKTYLLPVYPKKVLKVLNQLKDDLEELKE